MWQWCMTLANLLRNEAFAKLTEALLSPIISTSTVGQWENLRPYFEKTVQSDI